ncbi:hypothetical protein, partial [Klebsiella pneumoniae]|uniref:hypothetical protein n=1 Tax=Klebsiella pneumoniae TaxID=573 RepID=UPI0013D6257A
FEAAPIPGIDRQNSLGAAPLELEREIPVPRSYIEDGFAREVRGYLHQPQPPAESPLNVEWLGDDAIAKV